MGALIGATATATVSAARLTSGAWLIPCTLAGSPFSAGSMDLITIHG
eukprot:CAMPEP_0182529884 /NCGR_PEP_ID=MMETSP1323-20130603/5508_1 /TAXON_ID=236787 /ORGANISM="Florenciella parvula, Strain RCC1693" /LENGTH=46 /DNA_ID= /DNA_START= /DNA_END= /DNA_ORIENTATION=